MSDELGDAHIVENFQYSILEIFDPKTKAETIFQAGVVLEIGARQPQARVEPQLTESEDGRRTECSGRLLEPFHDKNGFREAGVR